MTAEFQRKGSFSEIVLPQLLAQALQSRFTGMFRAERESIIKVIYFRDGEIAFASSNQPSDRLGEVLIKRGQLSRERGQKGLFILIECILGTLHRNHAEHIPVGNYRHTEIDRKIGLARVGHQQKILVLRCVG